jgi:uncharacterized membrane protein YjfL (UPF0719 family)
MRYGNDLYYIAFLVVSLAFMYLAKVITELYCQKCYCFSKDTEIVDSKNTAVGFRLAGLYIAIALGLSGALIGSSAGFANDLKNLLVDGTVLLGLLFVAWWINDKVMLSEIDNTKAIKEGNTAVGLVEVGSFIATGLIAKGSLIGNGSGWLTVIVFFFLGQIFLVAYYKIYEKLSPYDDSRELASGNNAAGLMIAGMMIGLGIILSKSVTGDFSNWHYDITMFCISAAKGMVGLLVFTYILDRLFLPKVNIFDAVSTYQNVAAVSVSVAIKIGLCLIIAAAIL